MSGHPPNTVINVRPSRRRLIRFSNGLQPGNTHNTVRPTAIGATYSSFYNFNQPPPQSSQVQLLPPQQQVFPQRPQKRPNWWFGGKRKSNKTRRRNRN